MNKHTPGPWAVDLDGPFTLGGDTVAVEALTPDGEYVTREICTLMLETDAYPDGDEWLEDAANARLISAAPALLEALERALSWLTSYPGGGAIACYDQARAALAKAKGETP